MALPSRTTCHCLRTSRQFPKLHGARELCVTGGYISPVHVAVVRECMRVLLCESYLVFECSQFAVYIFTTLFYFNLFLFVFLNVACQGSMLQKEATPEMLLILSITSKNEIKQSPNKEQRTHLGESGKRLRRPPIV